MTLGCMLPNRLLTGTLIFDDRQPDEPALLVDDGLHLLPRALLRCAILRWSESHRAARSMRASSGVAGFCCRTNQKCVSPDDRQTFWPLAGVGGTPLCKPEQDGLVLKVRS